MNAKRTKTGKSDRRPKPQSEIEDRIARRAYAIYLERGGEHRHDLDDWLRAEREILESENRAEKK